MSDYQKKLEKDLDTLINMDDSESVPKKKRITVIFEEAEEMDGWWIASSHDLPGVLTQGEGLAETIGNFKDAFGLMEEDESTRPDGLEGRGG